MTAEQPTQRRWLSVFVNTIVCVAILAGSAAAIVAINRTEPTAQQINSKRTSAALVETTICPTRHLLAQPRRSRNR